ncbi:hypothetical protein QMT40_000571 [Parvibaculaceae bacterium PLY_AMNH_Bact1]|nr:hypothetical protein QMT40_000571 [Parvibaculaceae bacterium PLY_AMNH_Bact1]
MIGHGHSLGGTSSSVLTLVLGQRPGANAYARFDDRYGDGGLYYSTSEIKSFADVIATPPVGEPTLAGLNLFAAATNSVRSPVDIDGISWNQSFNCITSGDTVSHGPLTLQGISTDGLSTFPQIRGGGAADAITIGDGEKCSVTYFVQEGSSSSFYVGLTPTAALQTSGAVFSWSSGAPVCAKSASFHAATSVDGCQVKPLGGGLHRVRSTVQNNSGSSLSYYPFIYPFDVTIGDATIYDNALYIGGINVVAGDGFSPLITSASTRAASTPTLVQGDGSVPYPGYSGTEHTVSVSWDADGTTGDRVVWSAWKDADNRLALHVVSGALRFESFVGGESQGAVTVAAKDDGGAHSAVIYWDEVTNTLSIGVDGAANVSAIATDVPTNLIEFHLGHSGGVNQLNGLFLEHAAANGDHRNSWRGMPS